MSKLKEKYNSSHLLKIVADVKRYFHREVKKLEEDSWKRRLLRTFKKLFDIVKSHIMQYKKLE